MGRDALLLKRWRFCAPEFHVLFGDSGTRAGASLDGVPGGNIVFRVRIRSADLPSGGNQRPRIVRFSLLSRHLFQWTNIPQPAWLVFFLAFGFLLRFLLYRKPVESGAWSLGAVLLSLQAGGVGKFPLLTWRLQD